MGQQKNVTGVHYDLPEMPRGSARTSIRQKLDFENGHSRTDSVSKIKQIWYFPVRTIILIKYGCKIDKFDANLSIYLIWWKI